MIGDSGQTQKANGGYYKLFRLLSECTAALRYS
ncbi:hypothetical protein CCACVL1_29831 [Corchorus capsularis]|uniref:Uncharacterized protein n=1 Tax=Corchorus capsularis TaxID=210143 RepID=A0A1R3G037_COCAP|nr:hypothetical protein CCACVL1_29831 [Corchorus capsularis]